MTTNIICKKCKQPLTLKTHLRREMCGKCIYREYKAYMNSDVERKKKWTKVRNDNFYADPLKKARKLAYVRRWMKENSERRNEYTKEWRERNVDKVREYSRRSYLKKKGF